MLSIIERVILLRSVDMFATAEDAMLAGVAEIMDEVEAHAGDDVVQQGELGTKMYVVVSGGVDVQIGDSVIARLGASDVFGELAALDPEPRSATVTAAEHTLLLSLDHAPLLELMAEDVEVAAGIIRFLCERIRKTG